MHEVRQEADGERAHDNAELTSGFDLLPQRTARLLTLTTARVTTERPSTSRRGNVVDVFLGAVVGQGALQLRRIQTNVADALASDHRVRANRFVSGRTASMDSLIAYRMWLLRQSGADVLLDRTLAAHGVEPEANSNFFGAVLVTRSRCRCRVRWNVSAVVDRSISGWTARRTTSVRNGDVIMIRCLFLRTTVTRDVTGTCEHP